MYVIYFIMFIPRYLRLKYLKPTLFISHNKIGKSYSFKIAFLSLTRWVAWWEERYKNYPINSSSNLTRYTLIKNVHYGISHHFCRINYHISFNISWHSNISELDLGATQSAMFQQQMSRKLASRETYCGNSNFWPEAQERLNS